MKTPVFSVYRDTLNFPNFTPIKKTIINDSPSYQIIQFMTTGNVG